MNITGSVNERYIPLFKHPLVIENSIMQQNSSSDTINFNGDIDIISATLKVNGTQVVGEQTTTITTVSALTTSGGNTQTAGSSLTLIGDTTAVDQANNIMQDFQSLKRDIGILKTRLNLVLSAMRTHGLIET